MSVYYDVKEYLEIREIAGGNDPMVDLARKHLAWLGWKMLDDSAWVRKIFLSCGEKNYVFSGDTVCADFHDIIRALADDSGLKAGTAIKLSMDYHYRWTGGDPQSAYDHLVISGYLEQANEEETKNIFYTMYNNADCGDGAGVLSAYGERNGRVYKGIVQDKPISDFPDSGHWYAPREVVIYQPETLEGVDMVAVRDIVKQLETLSEDDNLTDTEAEFSYCMDHFQARSVEDFQKFVCLASKLIELTDGECCVIPELVDWNDPYGRILKINVKQNGEYAITIASVE